MRNVFSFTETVTLSDEQLRDQIEYCGKRGWAQMIEYTMDPGPDNHFWEQWGLPILDPEDPELVFFEVNECREAFPNHHIRINAYESRKGQALIRHAILVHAPDVTMK